GRRCEAQQHEEGERGLQFFHGSLTCKAHVVSSPTITTPLLLMLLTRRPETMSPIRTTRDPSIPGNPSTTADGWTPSTIPANTSVGRGGRGASDSAKRSGS